jgi:hypothetical protein
MKLNDVIDLVYSARQSGIDIQLNDGNLQLKMPSGAGIDTGLLENIKQH